MKRKDIWVLAGAVILALVLLVLSKTIKPTAFKATLTLEDQPQSGQLPQADSYLRIKQDKQYYHLIPLVNAQDLTIAQEDGKVNVIHIDKDMAFMKSANCPNQDCIHQGTISLSNYQKLMIQQTVICLPNKIFLELIPREDALRIMEEKP